MKNFVIGSMYWINPKASLDELREDMRRIRENGITLLRTFISWENVEMQKGEFDFSLYDRFFHVAGEFGIQVMATLCFYTPFYLVRDWLEEGIDDRGRRVPCLDRPEVQSALSVFIRETVLRYRNCPSLKIWNVWNEPTEGLCRCPHTMKAFVKYLHEKYHTMDELRESWAGEYYIFNPVLPESLEALDENFIQAVFNCAKRGRDTGMRLDRWEFNAFIAAEHTAWLVGEVRKSDSVHECHANPAQEGNPLYVNGLDPFLVAKKLDSVSGSLHPHGFCADLKPGVNNTDILPQLTFVDRFRSWGQGKDAYIGEQQAGSTYRKKHAYTPRGRDLFAILAHAMARGLKGVIFWEWQSWRQSFFEVGEFSLRNSSDGGPTERSESVREFAGLLDKHRDFFSSAEISAPQVAIFESMGQHSLEAEEPIFSHTVCHWLSESLCHRALAAAGIKADFVTECILDDEVLSHYKVLILPHVQMITPSTAEKLIRFVRNGGAVWADGRCGYLDAHTCLRRCVPCNGLDQLFGCREIDEVAPFSGDEVETKEYGKITPYRILQRLEVYPGAESIGSCSGYPSAVRNTFGAGKTEYWGMPLCWGDSQNGTGFADRILVDFVRRNGVAPDLEFTGKGCLVSCIHSGRETAVIVTNDSASSAEFRVKIRDFSGPYEEWTDHAVFHAVRNDEAVWEIPAGETCCILGHR